MNGAPEGNRDVKVCGGLLTVTGFIHDVPCRFTIDTGADVTILSHRLYQVYDPLNETHGLEASGENEKLKGLNGHVIPVVGKTSLPLQLGERMSTHRVWIARIQEDCILGTDFLKKEGCVIDYPQQILRMEKVEIPIHSNAAQGKCLRLIVDKSVKIPGFTEMVIPAKIKEDQGDFRWGTVGATDFVKKGKGIMVGRTLVDMNKEYIPVRVANLVSSRQKLKKGTELAVCEPVASITPGPFGDVGEDKVCAAPLPDHIRPLFEKTAEELNEEQNAQVMVLLVDYQDIERIGRHWMSKRHTTQD